MRIYELKISDLRWLKSQEGEVYDYDPEYGEESPQLERLHNYMTNNGYTFLGSGHFSKVYGSADSSIVIKISKRPDSAYVDFINFYHENKRNPYLPKVSRKMVKLDSGGNLFVAFCERLDDFEEASAAQIKALSYLMLHAKQYVSSYGGRTNDWYMYLPPPQKDEPKYATLCKKWLQKNPGFIETMNMVIDRAQKNGFDLDMKPDNFRYRRSNNKFVMTDPYYNVDDC